MPFGMPKTSMPPRKRMGLIDEYNKGPKMPMQPKDPDAMPGGDCY
jgi:hypothetical protein